MKKFDIMKNIRREMRLKNLSDGRVATGTNEKREAIKNLGVKLQDQINLFDIR